MREYKVTRDQSARGDNNPEAIEKMCNEMAADRWQLVEAVTFAAGAMQKMYFFWEREKS
jgi:hypothetical protein